MLRRLREDAETPEFGRLLFYQATGAAGDAFIAIALAGSLFFSVPEAEARGQVALYLVLTMAPFAFVAPFLARFLDRSRGRLRAVLVVAALGRGTCAWLLSTRVETLYLFPIAFGILVLSRAVLVARGAVLPQLVSSRRTLVGANAALSKSAALAGVVAGIPGILLIQWPGVSTQLLVAAFIYYLGAVAALRLPAVRGKRLVHETLGARAEARTVHIRQALFATSGMRFLVGFTIFHLAFALRREGMSSIGLGLLVGAAATGGLLGALIAPRLRRRLKEAGILVLALVLAGVVAIIVGLNFTPPASGALVLAFGIMAGAAKVAFDASVQASIPEAARGWAFARYESYFQLAWVGGALVPLIASIPAGPGVFWAGILANVVAILYLAGRYRVSVAGIA